MTVTTTVRLDPDMERALDRLAELHGGRSAAIRHAVRMAAAEADRRAALRRALDEWATEAGPLEERVVTQAAGRFGLAAP